MSDEYWQRFVQTGSVNDYLEYKKHNEEIKAENNEIYNKGACNSRTDNRGEGPFSYSPYC